MAKTRADDLIRIMRAHPRSGSFELCARLGGVNRSTLARALKSIGDAVVAGGETRRTRYALKRPLRGNSAPIPLYRIDERGQGHEIGLLSLTYPEGSFLSYQEGFLWHLDKDMSDGWFEGLPYPLLDMRPQGFLGRNFARAHARVLGVSDNPEFWTDDDVVHVLAATGHDQPGNLILGEAAYRRFLDGVRRREGRFVEEQDVETEYLRAADHAMRHGEAASSAGGEFPKFTSRRQRGDRKFDVIVKFSGADDSAAVRRWSDLLVCEHLALEVLRTALNMPSAYSAICRYEGRTFLEVERFDRHGESGRSPVCTLGSVNAALIGAAGISWPKIAQRLNDAGWLAAADVENIGLIWWFGELIANSDMHEGNLAFRPGLRLAPIYDMLPMAYAPMRGGELPTREFLPALPLPSESGSWQKAASAAILFWGRCSEDERISGNFRRICGENRRMLEAFRAR